MKPLSLESLQVETFPVMPEVTAKLVGDAFTFNTCTRCNSYVDAPCC